MIESASPWARKGQIHHLSDRNIGRIGLAVVIAYALARCIVAAAAKAFWFDEICTFIIANHSPQHSILGCLRTAMDGQPPFFYLLEKGLYIHRLMPEISLRIPSMLALCCTLIAVYAFIRRRNKAPVALICALTVLLTAAFQFAVEARPYSLMVAATAGALVAYQRAKAPRWAYLFGFFLVFGECIHYYMIFVIIAFGVAEAVLVLKSHVVRGIIWGSIALGFVPLIIFWPLLARVKAVYGSHFWAVANIHNLARTYGIAFDFTGWPGVIAGLVLVMLALNALLWRETWNGWREAGGTPLCCERIVIAMLVLLPFVEFAAAKISGGGYTARYALPLILVVPITLSNYLEHFKHKRLSILVTLVMFLFCLREGLFWERRITNPPDVTFPTRAIEAAVTAAGHSDLPVVFADGLNYLQSFYYADPAWRERFVYLADSDVALRYGRNDSVERNLLAIRGCAPVRVTQLDNFLQRHSTFLLDSEPEFGDHWWKLAFADMGYVVARITTDGTHEVYLIHRGVE